ncbi:MAG: hypothetical protein RBU37_26125, partial [Myxococcota bacterium]|nr:hypothetical protein [Myxococcota bacterium]
MKLESFLRELETLDHRARLARLRQQVISVDQSSYEALIETLDHGDAYLRRLALYSELFRAAREPKVALEAAWKRIRSPSVSLRSAAARVIGERAESIPSTLLEELDPQTLDLLLRRILLRRNGPIIDGLSVRQRLAQSVCESLCESGRYSEASVLLPACARGWIATRLDLPWPDKLWRRLATRHPELMLDRIAKDFASRSRTDLVWSRYDRGCWTALCRHAPEQILGWLEAHADATTLPPYLGEGLRILVRKQPQRMLRLMEKRISWAATQRQLLTTLARVERAVVELETLCRGLAQRDPAALTTILAELPFPSRGALFEYATTRDDDTAPDLRSWPLELLAILPTSLRDREAARMLTLQDASVNASWRRQLLALRLIDSSREALEKEAFSPQAAERGEAYIALIRSSWRSPSGLSQTLRYLQRIRNDQDPVRSLVLHALSKVPGHRFHDAEALDAVVSPIFDARDTSYVTRSNATGLAHRLLV